MAIFSKTRSKKMTSKSVHKFRSRYFRICCESFEFGGHRMTDIHLRFIHRKFVFRISRSIIQDQSSRCEKSQKEEDSTKWPPARRAWRICVGLTRKVRKSSTFREKEAVQSQNKTFFQTNFNFIWKGECVSNHFVLFCPRENW